MKRLLLSFLVIFIALGVQAQSDVINIIPIGNVGIGSIAPVQKLDVTGSVNVSSGYRIGNGATSGNYLRGNGTEFVSSAIQAGDLPTGSGNYIQNQITAAQTTSNFWISNTGRAAAFQLNNANTSLTEGSGDALRMTTPTGYIDIGSQNASWAHIQTDRPRYYFNVGGTFDSGLIGSYDEDLSLQTAGTTRITALNSNGNVGINATSPSARFHVSGGGQILGTNGTSSNTRTLTILEDGDAQINFGSYPGAWTSALQIQNNDNTDFVWISPLQDGNNARFMTAGSGLDIYTNGSSGSGGTFAGRFENNGSVGLLNLGSISNAGSGSDPSVDQGNNWITWGYRSDNMPYYCIRTNYKTYGSYTYSRLQLNWHTGIEIGASTSYGGTRFFDNSPGVGANQIMSIGDGDGHVRVNNYLFAQYLNSSDNSVGSGISGIMIKAGDNYLRTGTAAGVLSFLGITAPTGDNLGNHTATTTLNMNGNHINNVADIYATNNYGQGLMGVYSSTVYQNVFAMSNSYRLPANGSTPGNLYGIAWTHTNVGGQSKSGLGHQALFMENGVTQTAIGNGIWTRATSWMPFIYDLDNTGYYLDANSTSRQSVVVTDENYTYGWYRNYNANQGLYNQATGRHFYSESGSYWTAASGNGLIFRNSHAGTVMGYSYHDGGSSFGSLSPNGNWRFRCDNTNSEAYGSGFYAPTSYIGFIYDRDNTGYYLNPNGDSQTSSIYNNNWFRAQGSSGFYFQDYGGGWQMVDGTWIRAYNSKPILANGGIAGYGNAIGTWLGIAGNMMANYNNATGAGIVVSDDGGFGDWNDAWVQFRGTNGLDIRSNNTSWNTVFRMGNQDNSGTSDKLVTTGTNAWGLMGGSGNAWWQSWSYSFNNASQRELKKDITPVKGSLGDLVMADLDKMTPYLYRYNEETDVWSEQNRAKFRTGLHMGLILDETPDYIQSQSYTGVDIYAVASLGVAAGKYNREEIKQIKQSIGLNEQTMNIQDFGSMQLSGKEMYVSFSSEFSAKLGNSLPVVTITSNDPTVTLSVTEKSAAGFKVISSSAKNVSFDYIAMAKVKNTLVEDKEEITPEVMNRIRISESEKAKVRHYWDVEAPENQRKIEEKAREDAKIVTEERIKEIGIQVGDPAKESGKIGAENAVEIKRIADEAKRNYIAVPEDAPAKSGTLGDPNPSKEGAPKVHDLKPTPTPSLTTDPPPADPLPSDNK